MNIKETARTLATITEEQWQAILLASTQVQEFTEKLKSQPVEEFEKNNNMIERQNQIYAKICNLLKKIGIPQHILGYKYLQEAIYMVYEDEELIHNVTKELYPTIAKKNGTIWTRVERNIKRALDTAFKMGDTNVHEKVFDTAYVSKAKHPNSYAIAALVEYIKVYS